MTAEKNLFVFDSDAATITVDVAMLPQAKRDELRASYEALPALPTSDRQNEWVDWIMGAEAAGAKVADGPIKASYIKAHNRMARQRGW